MVKTATTALELTPPPATVGAMLRLVVREVAEKAGFKNALDLSNRSGLPYESVRRLWQGTSSMVSLGTLERLCQVLEVRPAQLFDYEAEPMPTPDKLKAKRESRAGGAGKKGKAK